MEVILQTYYILLPIVATALVGWVGVQIKTQRKKEDDNAEKQKAYAEGITMVLRYMLQRYHGEYLIQGKISYNQYKNWKDIFTAYRTLGGNSIALEWDEDIDRLEECESDLSPYEAMLKNK